MRKPIVLFVDADRTARTMFDFRAQLLDVPHFLAGSAEEAVAVLEEHRVDVVITDLFMPKYDAVDLIKCMREFELTKDIPVIIFTVGGNPQKMADAMSAGAAEIVMKQTTPMDKLIERVYALTKAALAREETPTSS
jgi:CheY-like chemotaxis protein